MTGYKCLVMNTLNRDMSEVKFIAVACYGKSWCCANEQN